MRNKYYLPYAIHLRSPNPQLLTMAVIQTETYQELEVTSIAAITCPTLLPPP